MAKKYAVGDRVRFTGYAPGDPRKTAGGATGTIVDRTKAGAFRPSPDKRGYSLVLWDPGTFPRRWCSQLEAVDLPF